MDIYQIYGCQLIWLVKTLVPNVNHPSHSWYSIAGCEHPTQIDQLMAVVKALSTKPEFTRYHEISLSHLSYISISLYLIGGYIDTRCIATLGLEIAQKRLKTFPQLGLKTWMYCYSFHRGFFQNHKNSRGCYRDVNQLWSL